MPLLNERTGDLKMSGEAQAILLLGKIRDQVLDPAAWNTLFDAQVYLLERADYQRAYGTGTLADRDRER